MAKKRVRFMITAFRDGFQSVYGARVFSKDYLPVIEMAGKAGIEHFEAGGGAMFQSPYFYANEDSFAVMDKFRAAAGPKADLQTLARGINVVGLDSQPRDVIRLHAKLFKKHGISSIRNFDALNDVNNLIFSGQCIHDAGLKHEVVVSMMALPPGAPGADRAHTAAFYVNTLKQILEAGIPYDSVCFKDASGTSTPQVVYETILGARKLLGAKVKLVFHSHETAGNGIMGYRLALDAGADQIDLSLAPASGGTCQPDLLSMWHALRGTDYELGIDVNKIVELEEFFKESMKDYFLPPEATKVEPLIPFFPMPGGALTTNTQMMRDNDLLHRYAEIVSAMGEVVEKGGFGTSVTPVSQFYFQQAFNNVMFGKWKKIADGYGKMVLGYFGKTPVAPDPEVARIAREQLKLEPTSELVVDINDRNPKKGVAAAKARLEKEGLPTSEENIFIAAACEDKGIQFLLGKATIGVRKEARKDAQAEAASAAAKPAGKPSSGLYTVTVNATPYSVKIEGATAVVNGVSYAIDVKEGAGEQAAPTAAVESDGYSTITAPLPGLLLRVPVKAGDSVSAGDVVLVLESMKMETPIKAVSAGVITELPVSQGQQVKSGQLLAVLGPTGSKPGQKPAPAPAPKPAAAKPAPAAAAADRPAPAGSTLEINAPLPGLILRVVAKQGDKLKEGDVILVLESMKMETPIKAAQAGTLIKLAVNQGQQVKSGNLLAVLGV